MPRALTEDKLHQITAPERASPTVVLRAAPARPAARQASVEPQGVQMIVPALIADLSAIQLVDPEAARALAQVGHGGAGLPRERVSVPICRVPEMTDAALFEDPADPA